MGNVYIAGSTYSADFPVTADAYDTSYNGDIYEGDAFVAKLDPMATTVLYATYLGGLNSDCNSTACVMAVDGTGNVYLAGLTYSADFPVTADAYDTSYNGGHVDAFIAKLALGGSSILFADQTLAQECPLCSSKEKQNTAGGPINTYSGNYNYQTTDLSLPTLGQPLSFQRTYNSLTTLTDTVIYNDQLGYGWTHNYDVNLTLADDPYGEANTVILKAPHGSRMRFTDNGDGTYSAAPGVWATLERRGSSVAPYTYVITAANQTVYSFGVLTDSVAVEPVTASSPFSLTLSPNYQIGAAPGTVLTLTHTLTNNSDVTDTYDLAAANAWITVDPPTATLVSGAAITVTATLTTPEGYGRDAVITTSIRATAQTSPTLTATAVETITLRGYRLLTLQDPQGNRTLFDYDSQGYLGQASGPTGQRYLNFSHDSQGRLTAVTDHTGRGVSYGYDALDNLTVITDTRNLRWTYVYTGNHLLQQIIDPDGRTVEKTFFDVQARAVRQEDGLSNPVVTIDYLAGGQRRVTENGRVYTDTYDARGLWVSQEDSLGNLKTYDFDDSFNRNASIDGNGHATTYARTPLGLTTAITDSLNNVTTFTYDANNNLQTSTDARGHTTTYNYDAQNNLLSVTDPLSGTTNYTYNAQGQQTSVTDENENTARYGYDALGQRTVITDALGNVTRTEYDSLGRVVTTTDALGKVTLNEYDAADNLIRVTENYLPGQPQNYQDEYNLVTEYTYDGAGRRLTTTDTLGRVTRNIYDAAGRLAQTIQNEWPGQSQNYQNEYNLITSYGYDAFGRQVSVTDTLGRETQTIYDAVGRVQKSIVNYVDGTYNPNAPDEDIITEFVYDANGNLLETIDTLGRVTRTDYDALNRVAQTVVNYSDGNYSSASPDEDLVTAYGYDAVGNQTVITDTLGRETHYSYDALNRVQSITNPLGGVTTYDYDPAGNRTGLTDAEGRTTSYAYDALNRVITTTNALRSAPNGVGGQTGVTYDAVGNRLTSTDANGHTTTFSYDSLYRLTATTDAENQTTATTYDALGNRLSTTDPENNTTTYQYDSLNRLIQTTNPLSGTTSVTYDALGNRLSSADANNHTTGYAYDDLNRLISTTDPNTLTTLTTYDGLGNRLSVTNGANETTTFGYDNANRLIQITNPQLQITSYQYDGAGNRVAMIDAEGVETRYGYDDLNRLVSVTENYVDGVYTAGVTDEDVKTEYGYDRVGNRTVITDARLNVTTYLYDDLNRRLEMRDPLNNLTQYGYDAIGNRTVLTDANGIVTTFNYDNVNRLTTVDYGDPSPGSGQAATPDVTFTYDKAGNRLTMADGSGTTSYTYDDLYRLTGVNDGAGLQVGYEYDPAGNRTKLIYPDNRQVNYSYDAGNRLDVVTDWHNGQFGYNYDQANRLTGLSLPNGVESSYSYDEAGRLTLLAHSTLTDTLASYAYSLDKVGNRRVLTEALVTVPNLPDGTFLENGGLVVMEAENGERTNGATHNWLLKTSQPGYTGTSYLQSSLDIDTLIQTGEITTSPRADYVVSFTTPGTYTVWLRGYAPNAAGDSAYVGVGGKVVAVSGFAPNRWSWTRVSLSSAPATLPISTTGLYTVSLWMREDGLRIDRLLLTTDTTYIPASFGPPETGRITDTTTLEYLVDRVIGYDYDNLYRLTSATYSSGESYAYEYDPVGNRLQQIINGDTTEYLYDAANRLAQLNGQAVYSFDNNGNLLSSDVLTNTWDAANRLVASERVNESAIQRIEPIYNGIGDRVGQTVGTTTTYFALDVQGLPEVIYTSEGNTYLHLPGVIVAESSTGETRYLLSDGLGSVRQATDDAGAVVAYNEFDPYGNPVQNDSRPYGFTGEWWQSEVGLLHLRARWYAPSDGIFLSRDPAESEPSYQYVGGNVVNWTDPSGMFPTRGGIADGEYSYSCNCGWIDWGHANGEFAWGLIDKLESLNSETEIDISAVAFRRFGYQGTVTLWISKKPDLPPNELLRTALGIFKDIEFQVEELQGSVGIGPFRPGLRSYFSEEDLSSDLIGFYRAVWERRGAHPSVLPQVEMEFCTVDISHID